MSFPKVSVVIVNWNNFNDTAGCIDSLKKVTYPNCEIIVVDNGSQGDDVNLLRQRFGDSVRLIANGKNRGFAGGCNIGIEDALSRGADYVALLNNDTVVAPDFLEAVVRVAEGDKKVGIAGGKIYCYELPEVIWFAGGVIDYRTGRTPIRGSGEKEQGKYEEVTEVDWICGCFMFLSKDVLQNVGLLDERFFFGWEDADYSVRAAKKGFKVVFVPSSKIWHKGFGAEKRERLKELPVYYAARGQFLFMDKHFGKRQLLRAWLTFALEFPRFTRQYSRMLKQWKVPFYILWGICGYLRIKILGFIR
ncbi:MAG: glycosyltransferase family 2 protein [Chloroflexi bacterium]|nr:glycosyltransferase family 2 protein [Chloroflexota bacterium]